MRIAIGCDPTGFPLKEPISDLLRQHPDVTEVIDLGVAGPDDRTSNHVEIGTAVGEAVATGKADRGLAFCGNGLGVTIAACKIDGVAAVTVHDVLSARSSVTVNEARVLCMGAKIIGPGLAATVVEEWLRVPYPEAQ